MRGDIVNYVRIKDIREELGISQKGLDNALKRKEIEKKYPFEGNIPYVSIQDAEIIKKHIATNGRVKAILEKDKKDFELEQEYLRLKEEHAKNKDLITDLKSKLNNSNEKIENLKFEKETLTSQINYLKEHEIKLQNNLEKEKIEFSKRLKIEDKKFKSLNSRFREVNLRSEEINKLYLLEKAKVETLINSLEDNKKQLLLLENNKKDFNSKIESVKEELHKVEEKLISKEEDLLSIREQLEIEIKSKEALEEEHSKLKNMNFVSRLKFLFKSNKQ